MRRVFWWVYNLPPKEKKNLLLSGCWMLDPLPLNGNVTVSLCHSVTMLLCLSVTLSLCHCFNYQLSIINYQLANIHCQLSIAIRPSFAQSPVFLRSSFVFDSFTLRSGINYPITPNRPLDIHPIVDPLPSKTTKLKLKKHNNIWSGHNSPLPEN